MDGNNDPERQLLNTNVSGRVINSWANNYLIINQWAGLIEPERSVDDEELINCWPSPRGSAGGCWMDGWWRYHYYLILCPNHSFRVLFIPFDLDRGDYDIRKGVPPITMTVKYGGVREGPGRNV